MGDATTFGVLRLRAARFAQDDNIIFALRSGGESLVWGKRAVELCSIPHLFANGAKGWATRVRMTAKNDVSFA
jgi:hypothetical protein